MSIFLRRWYIPILVGGIIIGWVYIGGVFRGNLPFNLTPPPGGSLRHNEQGPAAPGGPGTPIPCPNC